MVKLMDVYKSKKLKDNNKIYMFKVGVFYCFLHDDARFISSKYYFKLTKFGDSVKCGFPIKSLEKYLFLFNNENIELVVDSNKLDNIIKMINNLDLNEISPREAYIFLSDLKEKINE